MRTRMIKVKMKVKIATYVETQNKRQSVPKQHFSQSSFCVYVDISPSNPWLTIK